MFRHAIAFAIVWTSMSCWITTAKVIADTRSPLIVENRILRLQSRRRKVNPRDAKNKKNKKKKRPSPSSSSSSKSLSKKTPKSRSKLSKNDNNECCREFCYFWRCQGICHMSVSCDVAPAPSKTTKTKLPLHAGGPCCRQEKCINQSGMCSQVCGHSLCYMSDNNKHKKSSSSKKKKIVRRRSKTEPARASKLSSKKSPSKRSGPSSKKSRSGPSLRRSSKKRSNKATRKLAAVNTATPKENVEKDM